MRNIRKRGLAIGLSLMLGMAGNLGQALYGDAAAVKAAAQESSQKAAVSGIDILNYESNPSATKFVVNDIAGFEKVAELVNSEKEDFEGKTISLNADLKYDKSVENNHQVIGIGGNFDHDFCGIFDGGFHTISGINLNLYSDYVGVFGYTRSDAKISKIILDDSCIVLQGSQNSNSSIIACVGGIVGLSAGVVSECVCKKNVEVIGKGQNAIVGGIAGSGEEIIRCINFSTVSGKEDVGGISGTGSAWGKKQIKGCINYGTINVKSGDRWRAGGITGSHGEIVECCNMGEILSENETGYTTESGGIKGDDANVINSYNTGQIVATGKGKTYASGIVGWIERTSSDNPSSTIQNSYSVGKVENSYSGAIAAIRADCDDALSNCFWLTGTAPYGVWSSPLHNISSVFEYSKSQMQSQAFVDELNANSRAAGYGDVWAADTEHINNGYPILKNVPYKISDLTGNPADDDDYTAPDVPDEPLDTTPAAHFYEDHNYTKQATNSTIQVYANGGTVAVPGTTEKKNYKRCILYTDILPSYIYTASPNGAIKASSGKVVVGITATNQKPSLVKGKIADKSVSKIASATIKSGQITVTAKTQPGKVYLWAIDTGRAGESACIPVTVKAVPSATNIYAVPDTDPSFVYESTKQFKSGKANIGESVKVYLYPFYKDNGAVQKVKNVSYTATVAEKSAEYFSVSQSGGNPLCFEIRAKGLNNGKSVTGTVTFTCNLSGKKTTFRATAVNPVTRISTANASGLTRVSDTSFRVKASDAAKITGTFELRTVCSSDKDAMTDNLKIYAMGSADGYDRVQLKEGKVKITGKRSSEQGKISMKPAKDKKTVTVTVAKGAKPVTSYFLVVYNTVDSGSKKGYTVLSVTAE